MVSAEIVKYKEWQTRRYGRTKKSETGYILQKRYLEEDILSGKRVNWQFKLYTFRTLGKKVKNLLTNK